MAPLGLIAMELPHPTSLADERRRVLFTVVGAGIGFVVMLIADPLRHRTAPTAPAN